jgi:hypothetical protein
MEVKIYREPENEALILDEEQLAEYHELTAELGLQTVEQSQEQKVPNVYAFLNSAMTKQLHAICPKHTAVVDYKKSTIPVEVLKVLKFAKDNNMYEGYEIWYNDIEPDPLLIGWNYSNDTAREKKYDWQKDRFLMARWGDCAMELPELLQVGFDKLKQELLDKAKQAISTCKSVMEDPDVYVRKVLSEQSVNIDLTTTSSNTIY